ncbi:restriction endonuclease subunit S [Paenibacillus sp. GCM10027627]|uniref:restriction endonuclease subunit S n=1 Tax=unclassified Paenibacillus TaxID=185978 RepID=UPI0036388E6A
MKSVTLSDIIAENGVFIDGDWIESKDQDPHGEVRLIQLADIGDGIFLNKSNRFLTKKMALKLKCTFLQKGDLLIARMPDPLGRACIFPGDERQCVTVVDVCILRPNSKIIFNEYLKDLINNSDFRNRINTYTTGTTRKRISRSNLDKIQFDLPAYEDQIRIATVLTRVERLIAKRKESIKALDKFLKSTFVEMFRDVISRHGKPYIFDDLKADGKGTFSNGPFGSDLLTSELNSENGIPVIYIRDIKNGYLEWKSNVFVTPQKASSLPNCHIIPGDLLIAKVGDPPGIAAVCDEKMKTAIITQDVIRLRLNYRIVNPVYLCNFINSDLGKKIIKKITVKGTRKRFSLGDFKKLQLNLPDLTLQNRFASIVKKIENLKARYTLSLIELENLYGSLSRQAFKGELDLSKVLVETENEELQEERMKIPPLDSEIIDSKIYSEAELMKTILSMKGQAFSFDSLMAKLEKASFEVMPNYGDLKDQIYEMLGGTSPLLSQTLVEVKNESGKVENKIMLRVNI